MDNKELLLKTLQERLNYITFIETDECNPEEIAAIVKLIDVLDPADIEIDAEASYERFKEKYKDRLSKHFKRKRKVRTKLLCMICASAAALLIVFVQLDSSASYLKGFFQIFENKKNGISFLVTGNVDEIYKSFEDLPERAKSDLLIPSYIPSGLVLDKITFEHDAINIYYNNSYDDTILNIKRYVGEMESSGKMEIISGKQVYFSNDRESTTAKFVHNKYVYYISGNITINEIKKVISGLN